MTKSIGPRQLKQRLTGMDYVCHQDTLRRMIVNLAKIDYSSERDRLEFYRQFELIISMLWNKIESIQRMDPYLYTTYKLLNFLDSTKGICIDPRLKIMMYNYDSRKQAYILQNQQPVLSKIDKCNDDIVVIPMELFSVAATRVNTNQEQLVHSKHANLIILNRYSRLAWRVEPNAGTQFDIFNEIIDSNLEKYLKVLGYRYMYEYAGQCPLWLSKLPGYITRHLPLQRGQPMEYIPHNGLCMMISVGKFVYGNKLTGTILKDFIVKFFKSELKEYCGK
jgi:hypothetical protein